MDTNSDFRKTSVCQRIEEISKQEGISINALAAKIGVNQSTIATAIARDKGVNFDILYRIIKAFPHLSAEWLITGEGAIHKSEQTNAIPPRRIFRRNALFTARTVTNKRYPDQQPHQNCR